MSVSLKEEEITALRACMEVACPSPDDREPWELWTRADKALKMLEGDTARRGGADVPISRMATDDTSPKYLVQVDLFNIYSASKISPEGLKDSMKTMVMAAVLNEIKIIHQREIGRPLAKEDATGMLRNIRNSITVVRVR